MLRRSVMATAMNIAAGLPRRLEHRMDIAPGSADQRGDVRWEQAGLNLPCDPKVAFGGGLDGVRVCLRLEQRADTCLHLEDLERFRGVIVAARLEPARLVL